MKVDVYIVLQGLAVDSLACYWLIVTSLRPDAPLIGRCAALFTPHTPALSVRMSVMLLWSDGVTESDWCSKLPPNKF